MDNRYSIFKKEPCFICKGERYIFVEYKLKGKKYIGKTLCPHCGGKGFLKILKSDYDY